MEILVFELTGAGRHPRLRFGVPDVMLPAVPLNVESSAVFFIENDGYDNLDIKFRLPADSQNLPLRLEFPEVRARPVYVPYEDYCCLAFDCSNHLFVIARFLK